MIKEENISIDENYNLYEQVAVIPYLDKLYVILKIPTKLIVNDHEIVCLVKNDEEDETSLIVIKDKKTIIAVYNEYHKLLKELKE